MILVCVRIQLIYKLHWFYSLWGETADIRQRDQRFEAELFKKKEACSCQKRLFVLMF